MTAAPVTVPEAGAGLGLARPARPRRRSPSPGSRRSRTFPPLRGLLPLVVLLWVWEVVGNDRSPYFPPPGRWARAVARLWDAGTLAPAAAETLGTLVVALGLATILGALLGLLVGASRTADRALRPTLEFARVMPPAAMVPIAALLIGYDETMKVVVVTASAMWPILLSTKAGVLGLSPTVFDVARSLHLKTPARVRKVTLPALLPALFLGIRVAAPVALVITLLVEIVTQLEGLGALLGNAQRTYQSAQVYGLILVAGLLNLVLNGALAALEAYAFRHRPRL